MGFNSRSVASPTAATLEIIKFTTGRCSLGHLIVAASAQGVRAILLGDDPQALASELKRQLRPVRLVRDERALAVLLDAAITAIESPASGLALPLDPRGTAFQQRVWQALRAIPPGATASYAQIAQRIGASRAVRAVARACAANTLAVAIPCHRVVRSDGGLSGYRWGVERKRALLERESTA